MANAWGYFTKPRGMYEWLIAHNPLPFFPKNRQYTWSMHDAWCNAKLIVSLSLLAIGYVVGRTVELEEMPDNLLSFLGGGLLTHIVWANRRAKDKKKSGSISIPPTRKRG